MNLQINIKTNFKHHDSEIPQHAHEGDAGVDLRADTSGPVWIHPGETIRIPTGIYIALPQAGEEDPAMWEMQIRSRSGWASRGIIVANSPGTIDSSYRGEIQVILANIGSDPCQILPGDRVAQAVVSLVAKFDWNLVDDLDDTSRNTKGLGSTGVT